VYPPSPGVSYEIPLRFPSNLLWFALHLCIFPCRKITVRLSAFCRSDRIRHFRYVPRSVYLQYNTDVEWSDAHVTVHVSFSLLGGQTERANQVTTYRLVDSMAFM
jgi:hypothetical protein